MAASFGSPVDDFFVGKHGAQFWTPVDGLFAQIGQTLPVEDVSLLGRREFPPHLAVRGRRGPRQASIAIETDFVRLDGGDQLGEGTCAFDAVVVPR